MKTFVSLLVIALVSGGVAGADQGRARGEGRGEGRDTGRGAANAPAAERNVVFVMRDVTAIRTHYGTRYKNLPPGLQKKLARGGSLPPGWEKKMEPFPASLERNLVVLPAGYKRGVMDGHAVIYNPITHAIMDIAALF
jgi:hypothetical protein